MDILSDGKGEVIFRFPASIELFVHTIKELRDALQHALEKLY